LTQSISRTCEAQPDRQTVARSEKRFHNMVFAYPVVSRITAPKRLKAETPHSGHSSADRSLAKPLSG